MIFPEILKNRKFQQIETTFFPEISHFFIVSHVYPQLVASRNSHCAARGRGKRPAENPENPENACFWRFLGHFFLINYIGFSLKYVNPKSSTDFFHRKNRTFPEIFHFSFFSYISSPISESFIAQLLLHRALDKNYIFSAYFWENPGISLTNFLQML